MKLKISQCIGLLVLVSGLLNPFLFFDINPYAFLVYNLVLIAALLALIKNRVVSLWVIYLYSFQFFGLSIFGVKPYDFATLLFLILLLANGKSDLKVFKSLTIPTFIFFLAILLVSELFRFPTVSGMTELIRYGMCFLVLITFSVNSIDYDELKKYLTPLILCHLIQGVLVYFYIYIKTSPVHFQLTGIDVDFFYIPSENRIAGFSHDPNKYYAYSFFFLLLTDLMEERPSLESKRIRLLSIVCAIISLSRLAIFSVCIYLVVHFIYRKLFLKSQTTFKFLTILFFVFSAISFQYVLNFSNEIIEEIAIITGRTRALKIEPNITEGNRMYGWRETIDLIEQKPFFGHGLYSWEKFLEFPPHNTILVLLLDIGIFGLLVYLCLTWQIQKRIIEHSFLFLYFLPSMTLDMQHYRLYFILLSILLFQSLKKNTTHNESLHHWSGGVR